MSINCSRHAPSPFLTASHLTFVGLDESKCLFSIIFVIACFILLKATSCLSDHFNFEPLMLFFVDSNCLRGAVIFNRFGINLVKWCMLPMN